MYVVIDAECEVTPERVKQIPSAAGALLNFLCCLGYDPADPPFADLLRQYHHLEGAWAVLSPVHWTATHNDAMITAYGHELQVQERDAQSWFSLLAQYFAEEGMHLHYHNPETWLLSNGNIHSLRAKPVHYLVNQSLMPELAQLDQTMYWQKFFTECQMLFASKPNASLMNGLWSWGNAPLQAKKELVVCADEPFLPWARICATRVDGYHSSCSLKDYNILLLSDLSQLSEQHQQELKKMTTHWYWNNVAYTQLSSGWFVPLWRKLFHAY